MTGYPIVAKLIVFQGTEHLNSKEILFSCNQESYSQMYDVEFLVFLSGALIQFYQIF